jgi:hypothetical protein
LIASPPTNARLDWVRTDTGYVAQQVSERTQEVCVCEAYACGRESEPVTIAFDGWLKRQYAIVKDTQAGEDPSWGRRVATRTECVSKLKAEPLILTLTEIANEASTSVPSKTILKLELK